MKHRPIPGGREQKRLSLTKKALKLSSGKTFYSTASIASTNLASDIDDAKEAVHLGFIKLWERRADIEKDTPIAAYLQKIIHNNCLDFLKHEKVKLKYRNTRLDEPEHDETHSFSQVDIKLLEANIREAINNLPPQMKKVFEMSRFDGLAHAEIARRMNLSKKTVETQIGRAIKKLKEKLEIFIGGSFLIFFIVM